MLKSDLEQLSVTESWFGSARAGADPHVHHAHADSFYVLEGELAFVVHDDEVLLGSGGCLVAPPGLVHGFRTTRPSRFLNFHTPDGRFAANLRERDRDEPGGFDSVEAQIGSGLPACVATLCRAGEGEHRAVDGLVATIKAEHEQIAIVELELEPGCAGPPPVADDGLTHAFYVLAGKIRFHLDGKAHRGLPGSFIAVPPGSTLDEFASGADGGRLLHVAAPGSVNDRLDRA